MGFWRDLFKGKRKKRGGDSVGISALPIEINPTPSRALLRLIGRLSRLQRVIEDGQGDDVMKAECERLKLEIRKAGYSTVESADETTELFLKVEGELCNG